MVCKQGLTHHLVLMDGELGERWGEGDLDSCAEWQPEPRVRDSFLVGIWDSEDGVVAMFARPLKEDEMLTKQQLADTNNHTREEMPMNFSELAKEMNLEPGCELKLGIAPVESASNSFSVNFSVIYTVNDKMPSNEQLAKLLPMITDQLESSFKGICDHMVAALPDSKAALTNPPQPQSE